MTRPVLALLCVFWGLMLATLMLIPLVVEGAPRPHPRPVARDVQMRCFPVGTLSVSDFVMCPDNRIEEENV